jgi:predicted site-specific integrase-resolvase
MTRKMVGIQEAATFLGVTPQSLRRWERSGKLVADARTAGGRRRYNLSRLRPEQYPGGVIGRRTVGYARVSSLDQKEDLERQRKILEVYCATHGWRFDVVVDLGSGVNDRKKGLRQLLTGIVDGQIGRLVITHKDRLLRFSSELVFAICETRNVEVVILNQGEGATFEEELEADVLEITSVLSARLYGGCSPANQTLIDGVRQAVENARNAKF